LLMGALLLSGFYSGNGAFVSGVVAVFILLILVFRTLSGREVIYAVQEVGVTFFGLFYVSYLFGYLLLLRELEDGRAWTFFLFLAVWAGDTGAYYIGTRFGRRKLFQKVSPKKTVEGSVGGLLCSAMAGGIGKILFFPAAAFLPMALLGAGLGLIGQIGDLAESILKRSSGIKDSGFLFPGHGGVLDRFDSIIFASPALYYLLQSGIV
jgi:phosphatidate cytidylyltransferase